MERGGEAGHKAGFAWDFNSDAHLVWRRVCSGHSARSTQR